MSSSVHDDSGRDPWTPPPGKFEHRVRDGAIIAVFGALLLVVQAPLLWMIVTSFKVKGTAFKLDFIPSTQVLTPTADASPIPLPAHAEGQVWWHIELAAKDATTVQLMHGPSSEPGEPKVPFEMRRSINEVWVADLVLPPGEYKYGFKVDGGAMFKDPTRPEKSLLPYVPTLLDASTATKRGDVPVVCNPESARSLVVSSAKSSWARLVPPQGTPALSLRLDDREVALAPATGGVFELGSGPPAKSYRVLEHRSFSDATSTMYTTGNFMGILGAEDFNFGRYALNSFLVSFSGAMLTVIICTLAGYGFAVKHFHFRDQIFWGLFACMLIPGMIFMVPQFSLTVKFGWLNTLQGMVVPHLANLFGLFLLRQYIGQIPSDLFDAAKIDGANEPQVFRNIVIPLCLPIMVTLFLLTFVTQWSNFLWQLIVNTGDSAWLTLPVGLQRFKGQFGQDWEKIMAGACFSILPIAALFVATQKYFLQGLTAGAVKE